jgi:hypothetical protein
MISIWNDRGAFVCPQRSVFTTEAPLTLARLDEHFPNVIRQNNYVTSPVNEEMLPLLKDAYAEAASRRSQASERTQR